MIVRNKVQRDFTVIRNEVLNRTDMSLRAKGLYCFLMSKPDGWQISYRGLCTQLKEGKDAVIATMKELSALGYTSRNRTNGLGGKLKWETIVSDIPLNDQNADQEPCAASPCAGKPSMVNPPQVNTNIVNTEQIKEGTIVPSGDDSPAAEIVDKRSPQINLMLDYWGEIMSYSIATRIQANRRACSNLLRKHGEDALKAIVRAVAAAQDDRYAPRIADFCALQAKLPDLMVWIRQKQNHANSNLAEI